MENNRLSVAERYQRDPAFARLVQFLYHFLESDNTIGTVTTPTELREAFMCAVTMYEHRHIRPMFIAKDKLDPDRAIETVPSKW